MLPGMPRGQAVTSSSASLYLHARAGMGMPILNHAGAFPSCGVTCAGASIDCSDASCELLQITLCDQPLNVSLSYVELAILRQSYCTATH